MAVSRAIGKRGLGDEGGGVETKVYLKIRHLALLKNVMFFLSKYSIGKEGGFFSPK